MKRRLLPLVLMFLAVSIFACAGMHDVAEEAHDAVADAHDADGDSDGDSDGDAADHDHGDPEPGAEHDPRAAFSKPHEVFEFAGLSEGDRVIDILAGGGYNSRLLSEVVGRDGMVYIEGPRPEFRTRVEMGQEELPNVAFVDGVEALEDGSIDAALAIRAYHLFPDVPETLGHLHRALVPGGTVAVVETRNNREDGHDMEIHRVGEGLVIADFEAAGFEYVGSSEILRTDDDDYTVYTREDTQRYQTDRMLLKFRKPQ